MATSPPAPQSPVAHQRPVCQTDDDLSCAVCMLSFAECDPIALKCGHSTCRTCLQGIVEKDREESVKCPHCRSGTPLGPRGLADFSTNWSARKAAMKPATPAVKPQCENCQEAEAVELCTQCSTKLCEACRGVIHAPRALQSHVIVPLGDPRACTEYYCARHKSNKMEIYCTQCQVGVCTLCVVTSHKDHAFQDVCDVAAELRAKLEEHRSAADAHAVRAREKLEEFGGLESLISQRANEARARVADVCAALCDAVTARRVELVAEIDELERNKIGTVRAYMVEMDAAVAVAGQAAVEATAAASRSDHDVVLGPAARGVSMSLRESPGVTPIIGVAYPSDLVARTRSFGSISDLGAPSIPGRPERVSSTPDSITLRWAAPAEHATDETSYEIVCEVCSGGKGDPVILPVRRVRGLEGRIERLDTTTSYRFRVRGSNGAWALGPFSDWSGPMRTENVPYTGDDTKGIFYMLGTLQGRRWVNPALRGAVTVTIDGCVGDARSIVDPAFQGYLYSQLGSQASAAVAFTFSGRQVSVSRYFVRGGNHTYYAQAWVLEGSNDRMTWTVLHTCQARFSATNRVVACDVTSGESFCHLRLRMTELAGGAWYFFLSNVELWGSVEEV